MDYKPFSPFKRPMSHNHLHPVPHGQEPVNKWDVLRNLAKAQDCYGLRDRDLAVLQALLSFHAGDSLDPATDLVVFASNRAICERLNGMPESTMRRHTAKLIERGLLARRDSPNGKRFRTRSDESPISFGLDLSPLPYLASQIKDRAEAVRAAELKSIRLRLRINLMRRDLHALCTYGKSVHDDDTIWQDFLNLHALATISIRRKQDVEGLTALSLKLAAAVAQAKEMIERLELPDLSTSDAQVEQHHQRSNEEVIDSEEGGSNEDGMAQQTAREARKAVKKGTDAMATPPLSLVTKACPEIALFTGGDIQSWPQLFSAACHLRQAIGIPRPVWDEAIRTMGQNTASVVLAAILQRFSSIRSPGAYLRSLCAKAAASKFSCIPLVASLLAARSECAA
ncbi:plasmid replication protein RepC [Stagnihabitans tardus]|uniref:Replication initiation protein n=1 Tax=Stagnihabitans tardus TaxID=2699202 RepID=A0AAE4YFR3_9RHOB|nr:plasmid replication protein RepC [Stagnihabitans tardus]NBZ89384.1 replication initiation protein [Stagnihabitans tardus]